MQEQLYANDGHKAAFLSAPAVAFIGMFVLYIVECCWGFPKWFAGRFGTFTFEVFQMVLCALMGPGQ